MSDIYQRAASLAADTTVVPVRVHSLGAIEASKCTVFELI